MPTTLETERTVISRYVGQPDRMPAAVRAAIEAACGGQPVQLYALADLDARLRLKRTWFALGPEHVALVDEPENGKVPPVRTIRRADIRHVEETPSLSATTLRLLADPDEPALAVVRYSHRQRGAMGAISFVLKQTLEGNALEPGGESDAHYARAMAEPVLKAQAAITTHKFGVVWRLLAFLKPYKWRFLAGLGGQIALTALMLLPPLLTGYLIDNALTPYLQGELGRSESLALGWKVIAILGAAFVVREFFLWVRLHTLTMVGELVARDLRTKVYDQLQKLSISFFSRHHTGSIIARVTSDTDRVWDFIAFGVADLLFSIVLLMGLSVVMVWMDWRLGLVLIIPVPILFLLLYWMGKQLHRVFLRIWQKWSEMTAVVGDTVPGIRVVQAFDQSDHERGRFNERNERVLDEALAVHRIWTSQWPLIYFGVNVMILLVWVFALPRLHAPAGDPLGLELGEFVTFLFLMGFFIFPLEIFGMLTRMINRALSSAHRVFEIMDTEPEIVEKEDGVKLRPLTGHIRFTDVTFGYDPVRLILKGVSFEVKPGEMIGLVGPSGAGKTTVINLMARFYDANTGAVEIDGVPIRDLDLGDYRTQIGMVMQDPYLFHGSIVENIRYGHHDANLDNVIAAAKAANAHDFICKLPNGYDTIVGERGHTLSGGERQRVSIARAILHNPRVLILDEATSSVDTETERKIQEAIDRLVEGRTVIAIAHRLSTLRRATRLIVMKDGRIEEMGTHEELLAREDGLYRKLQNMQKELHEMYAV